MLYKRRTVKPGSPAPPSPSTRPQPQVELPKIKVGTLLYKNGICKVYHIKGDWVYWNYLGEFSTNWMYLHEAQSCVLDESRKAKLL